MCHTFYIDIAVPFMFLVTLTIHGNGANQWPKLISGNIDYCFVFASV